MNCPELLLLGRSAFVAVNVLGNALATIVISGWEGALDHEVLKACLNAGPDEAG